jgi:DNA polymerase V
MEVLASVATDIEPYSIDEAFFSVPRARAHAVAHEVRELIGAWVGIPVSVGVAETKTLAKLMSEHAKAGEGVAVLGADRASIDDTPLGDVWGIGPSIRTTLTREGMHTVRDVLARRPSDMRAVLGVVGERLYYELSGTPAEATAVSSPHHMMSTRSFGSRVRTLRALETAVSYHLSRIAEDLRMKKMKAFGVALYLQFHDADKAKRSINRFIPLPEPMHDTRHMAVYVMDALRRCFNPACTYRKAGIIAHGIIADDAAPTPLFGTAVKGEEVMRALDVVNARYGTDTVHIGTIAHDRSWESKRTRLSPPYTTSWTALPHATMSDTQLLTKRHKNTKK